MSVTLIYSEMKARERKWPGFSNNVPVATIGHWYCDGMDVLSESVELDHWIRQIDHNYPVPSEKMFSPWTSLSVDPEHLEWITKQHDSHLQKEHLRNIQPSDRSHICHLINGSHVKVWTGERQPHLEL